MTATHRPLRPATRLTGLLGTGLALCTLTPMLPARADTVPPSIRACIGEADATRRLACYDREVARLIAPADTFTPAAAPAPSASGTAAAPPAARQVLPAPAPAVSQAQPAPAPSAQPVAAPTAAPAVAPAPAAPRHFVAKVSAVRQSGDTLVVTLEDGTLWVQSGVTTSQLNLKPGDEVHLDREIGSWFLSNRYGDNIEVKEKKPAQ